MKTIVFRRRVDNAVPTWDSAPATLGTHGTALESLAAVAEVSVEDLSEQDRADLNGRPEFMTANPIPLTLIRNVSDQAAGTTATAGPDPYANYVDSLPSGERVAWGVAATGAVATTYTGRDVPVAVFDTGIDKAHPAFAGVNIVEQDFSGTGNGDTDGHGTHCAGTIFGRDVDGVRIGIARGVTQAFIAKVIPGDSADLLRALNWAYDNGALVASMSLGYDFPGWVAELKARGVPEAAAVSMALTDFRQNVAVFDALMDLFRARALTSAGMVIVAATGNESRRPHYTIEKSPPASAFGVVGVGALQRSPAGLTVAGFSNTGPDVVAPGVGVLSAEAGTGKLVPSNGTSMATPHVAGLAALYWDQILHQMVGRPRADMIRSTLVGRARPTGLVPGQNVSQIGMGLATAP